MNDNVQKSNIGLIGLAVMGENLIMNMERNGYRVSVFNRTYDKVEKFLSGRGEGLNLYGAETLEELVESLEKPRMVMMMIKAGQPIDDMIEQLTPLLDKGDILIDGGNSNFEDSVRRMEYLEQQGFRYVGMGVSGGEEGALWGPSLMPGGTESAWEVIKPIFQDIAAKVGDDNYPCCQWIGGGGAGHYVKMVHNGIEYGDMQLIAEAYHIMHTGLGMDSDEIGDVFEEWNKGDLDSYLIEITANIFHFKDEDGEPLIERIMDKAGQKGTGKWTVVDSLDAGIPLTLIAEAVFSRFLSAQKAERVKASTILRGPDGTMDLEDKEAFVKDIGAALYCAKLISYAQGFALMHQTSENRGWNLQLGNLAMIWRGGCIIRSRFLDKINEAYVNNPELPNLLLDKYFHEQIESPQGSWRRVVAEASLSGIPVPAMASALSYYDGYRTADMPQNLVQAQRDYFGAHTYERKDKDAGVFFHTNWTGVGGETSSETYNA